MCIYLFILFISRLFTIFPVLKTSYRFSASAPLDPYYMLGVFIAIII